MARKPPACLRFNYVISKIPLKKNIGILELPEDHMLISLLAKEGGFGKNPVETVGSVEFGTDGIQCRHSMRFDEQWYPKPEQLFEMLEAASNYAREASKGTK